MNSEDGNDTLGAMIIEPATPHPNTLLKSQVRAPRAGRASVPCAGRGLRITCTRAEAFDNLPA